jgi:hypothetical protein
LNLVDQPYYTYSIQTPLSITFSGKTSSPSSGNVILNISIFDVSFNVNYNDEKIISQSTPVVSFPTRNMSIKLPSGNNVSFSATQYIGNLNVSNLKLLTQSGFVYMVSPTFNMNYVLPSNIQANSVSVGVYSPISGYNKNVSVNCLLQSVPSTEPIGNLVLNGV